jgi:hypothetical protein
MGEGHLKRLLMLLQLLLLFFLLMLISCKHGTDGKPVGNKENSKSSGQKGYLFSDSGSAWFISWTEVNNKLNGQLTVFYLKNEKRKAPETSSHPFEGMSDGTNVSLNFTGSRWTEALAGKTWTGTIKGKELTLVIPSDSGTLDTLVFRVGSVEQYNQAVQAIKAGAQQYNAKAQKEEDGRNEKIRKERAVANGNERIASSIKTLMYSTKEIETSSNYKEAFQKFSSTWKKMQKDYDIFKEKTEATPMTQFRLEEVQYTLETLNYDLDAFRFNSESLEYIIKKVNDSTNDLRKEKDSLSESWIALKNAAVANMSGEQKPQFHEDDIKKILEIIDNSINKALSDVRQAKQQRDEYLKNAHDLYEKAKEQAKTLKVESE